MPRGYTISLGYDTNVVVPDSSGNKIIFALDCENGAYKHSHYVPEMTQGLISTQEIIDFLKGIEAFTKPIFGSSMLGCFRFVTNHILKIGCLTLLSFPLGIILGITVHNIFFLIIIACPVLFMIFMTCFGCVNVFGSCYSKSQIEKLKDKIVPYVQSKNSQFVERGYHWVVASECPYWMELRQGRGRNAGIEVVNLEAQSGIPIGQNSTYSALNSHSPNYYSP